MDKELIRIYNFTAIYPLIKSAYYIYINFHYITCQLIQQSNVLDKIYIIYISRNVVAKFGECGVSIVFSFQLLIMILVENDFL